MRVGAAAAEQPVVARVRRAGRRGPPPPRSASSPPRAEDRVGAERAAQVLVVAAAEDGVGVRGAEHARAELTAVEQLLDLAYGQRAVVDRHLVDHAVEGKGPVGPRADPQLLEVAGQTAGEGVAGFQHAVDVQLHATGAELEDDVGGLAGRDGTAGDRERARGVLHADGDLVAVEQDLDVAETSDARHVLGEQHLRSGDAVRREPAARSSRSPAARASLTTPAAAPSSTVCGTTRCDDVIDAGGIRVQAVDAEVVGIAVGRARRRR